MQGTEHMDVATAACFVVAAAEQFDAAVDRARARAAAPAAGGDQ